MAHDGEIRNISATMEPDDEMRDLFSSFDEVSASDKLKEATLARVLALAAERDVTDEAEAVSNSSTSPAMLATVPASPATTAGITAIAGAKASKATGPAKRSKWRAIRVAAVAACLAMALGGSIAYATPASYYEVEQDGTTITLGVNCFGITVDATSDSNAGTEIIESTNLRNMPYEESLVHAIESMERRDPDKPVEYGPQGGEHEVANPQKSQGCSTPANDRQPQDESQPQGEPQGESQPQGDSMPHDGGQPQGESRPQEEPEPSTQDGPLPSQDPSAAPGQPGSQSPDGQRDERP